MGKDETEEKRLFAWLFWVFFSIQKKEKKRKEQKYHLKDPLC